MELTQLTAIAGSPALFPVLLEAGGIPNILGLLTHDNMDIACDVIKLLADLTDADAVEDAVRTGVRGGSGSERASNMLRTSKFINTTFELMSSVEDLNAEHSCTCWFNTSIERVNTSARMRGWTAEAQQANCKHRSTHLW